MYWIVTKLLPILFNILFFFIPLIVFPKTSELFEFNKMVATYTLTVVIISVWVIRMVYYRKVIFRRTILDIPILLFLFSQVISTILSIDPITSLFGYYSRLHGGLLSSLSYGLLCWAFVSNVDRKAVTKSMLYLLASGVLVSLYAIAQHFGIDKDIWVQDVVNRVFSTLGQPNWLAAWIVAILPLAWAKALGKKVGPGKIILWLLISLLFFLTLLYTKSRSGLLAFLASELIFWATVARKNLRRFIIWHILVLATALWVGTIWTPSLVNLYKKTPAQSLSQEPGGTESGDIRKIVWNGAIKVWKANPLFGTGVESFAYSYYNHRPQEHNLTSEWEYLYNKAHNEYLNFAANSGSVGIITYLILIGSILYLFKTSASSPNKGYLNLALLSGFISILVSNFFGFSVVSVAILFFLFPALSVSLSGDPQDMIMGKRQTLSLPQKLFLLVILAVTFLVFFGISKYWYADYLFAQGKNLNDSAEPFKAEAYFKKAIIANPFPTVYYDELASSLTSQSLSWFESGNLQKALGLAQEAMSYSYAAVDISPRDVSLKKSQAAILIKLSEVDPAYLEEAKGVYLEASLLAPTDAKIHYNLGLTYVRLGKDIEATAVLEKTVELKPDYRDARFALALIYLGQQKNDEAKKQLLYILENINPQDPLARQQLEEIP